MPISHSSRVMSPERKEMFKGLRQARKAAISESATAGSVRYKVSSHRRRVAGKGNTNVRQHTRNRVLAKKPYLRRNTSKVVPNYTAAEHYAKYGGCDD